MATKGFNIDRRALEKFAKEVNQELGRAWEREQRRRPLRASIEADDVQVYAADDVVGEVRFAAVRLLDFLFEERTATFYSRSRECIDAEPDPYIRELLENNMPNALSVLEADGLVEITRAMGQSELDFRVRLTNHGVKDVTDRGARRQDVALRIGSCRESLLRQAYGASQAVDGLVLSEFGDSIAGYFEAEPYSDEEIANAAAYLVEHEFVTISGASQTVRIEQSGIDCIEKHGGSMRAYANRDAMSGMRITVSGDVSGQLAVASGDVNQIQRQGSDADVLLVFAHALREMAGLVGLAPEHASDIAVVADQIEAEAKKDDPDQGWIKGLLSRAKALLGKAEQAKNLAQLASLAVDLYLKTNAS